MRLTLHATVRKGLDAPQLCNAQKLYGRVRRLDDTAQRRLRNWIANKYEFINPKYNKVPNSRGTHCKTDQKSTRCARANQVAVPQA